MIVIPAPRLLNLNFLLSLRLDPLQHSRLPLHPVTLVQNLPAFPIIRSDPDRRIVQTFDLKDQMLNGADFIVLDISLPIDIDYYHVGVEGLKLVLLVLGVAHGDFCEQVRRVWGDLGV